MIKLTEMEHKLLKKSGMLYEFFPEATGNWRVDNEKINKQKEDKENESTTKKQTTRR